MSGNHVIASLDIGGTSIKSGIIRIDGTLVHGSYHLTPVDSDGTAIAILDTFSATLANLLTTVQETGLSLAGIGIAIGGPFDFERGISKIRGLDKYEALYDVNVKEHLRKSLALSLELPLIFDLDAWAFGRGEVWKGAGQGFNRVIVFTLGTGVGSAFAVDGKIVDEGPGVPWIGWISGLPYKDGILNDYTSSVWMAKRYRALTGKEIDVRTMAQQAREGDEAAIAVFAEVGDRLGRFVNEHQLEQFRPDCFIFGGQISKSHDSLFRTVQKGPGRRRGTSVAFCPPSTLNIAHYEESPNSSLTAATTFTQKIAMPELLYP